MVIIFGKVIESISGISVVSPDGEEIRKGMGEPYAERLLKEENPWETLYELEVAQDIDFAGLDTKLVHEGSATGPDVFVDVNGTQIDIECKRRRPTHEDEKQKPNASIAEKVVNQLDIGGDSFFVELNSDGPLEKGAMDRLISMTVESIRQNRKYISKNIDGIEYEVRVNEYFSGKRRIDISRSDFDRLTEFLSPDFIQAFLSPFETDLIGPDMQIDFQLKFTGDGSLMTKDYHVFDFNFPTIDEKHHHRILENTISRGRSDLSGRSPAVLFVHIPAGEVEDMNRSTIEGYEDKSIQQIERLEQRIEGQLKNSSSLNAIVLNSTYFSSDENKANVRRGYKTFVNQSPEITLPDKFRSYLKGNSF